MMCVFFYMCNFVSFPHVSSNAAAFYICDGFWRENVKFCCVFLKKLITVQSRFQFSFTDCCEWTANHHRISIFCSTTKENVSLHIFNNWFSVQRSAEAPCPLIFSYFFFSNLANGVSKFDSQYFGPPPPLCLCSSWIIAILQPNLVRFDSNQLSTKNLFFSFNVWPSSFGCHHLVRDAILSSLFCQPVFVWKAGSVANDFLSILWLSLCCLIFRFPKCKAHVLIPSILIQPLPKPCSPKNYFNHLLKQLSLVLLMFFKAPNIVLTSALQHVFFIALLVSFPCPTFPPPIACIPPNRFAGGDLTHYHVERFEGEHDLMGRS